MSLNAFVRIFAIFIILPLVNSCQKKQEEVSTLEKISMSKAEDLPDSFFSDTTLIPLEFCEKCIIGSVSKIQFFNSQFIVSDKSISKAIFIFNEKGKFMFKIGESGEGPGKYVLPFDFSIIPNKNIVCVLDNFQSKLMYFDLRNGQFLNEEPIDFKAKSIHFIKDDLFAVHMDGNFFEKEKDHHGVIFSINDGEKTKFVYDFSKTDQMVTAGDFYNSSEGVLFSKSMNDTIYAVSQDGFIPKYFIDFGKKAISNDIKSKVGLEMFEMMRSQMPHYHNGNFIENSKLLFFISWDEGELENSVVYNKNQRKTFLSPNDKVLFKRPFYINEDFLFSYLTNEDFKAYDLEMNFGISENPVIVKQSFRKHF